MKGKKCFFLLFDFLDIIYRVPEFWGKRSLYKCNSVVFFISGDCVAVPHFPADRVSIILAICFILTAAAISVWKWKQNRSKGI